MIPFFTDPYRDELLYSAIARYHNCVGNIDLKDTLEDLFGIRSMIPTIGIQCNLDKFAKEFEGLYTSDELIKNNTIFPFYSPFIYSNTKEKVISTIKKYNGIGIYYRLGIIAGGICKKDGIYYCPVCAKNDIEKVGEPYIHREHQLEGVFLCPHHGEELKKYEEDVTKSRLKFTKFEETKIDFTSNHNIDNKFYDKLLTLSKGAYYILITDLSNIDKAMITQKYKKYLIKRNLANVNGRINQIELYDEFIRFYGNDFLEFMESNIDNNYEYNWLRVITRNTKRAVHPIRNLMFIYFLTGDIEQFFSEYEEYKPFGNGPWPCLNKVCENYKKDVIKEVTIKEDYKTKRPVGIFCCECGFTYSRMGPDLLKDDKFKRGFIKEFGWLGEKKLKECCENHYTIQHTAEIMGCDRATIKKYKLRLENKNCIIQNSNVGLFKLEEYRRCIIEHRNDYSTRTELAKVYKKEYSYLYRNDKKWLFNNLPQTHRTVLHSSIVDWDARDNELLEELVIKYKKMINKDRPVRISKSTLIKECRKYKGYFYHLDKLPKSKDYIDSICETVENFQLRRCKIIINKQILDEKHIRLWEIQRIAGIRTTAFNRIKNELIKYTQELQDRHED